MFQVGHVLEGRYRVVAEGRPQDVGAAYKAYDTQLERLVVVLLLDPRFRIEEKSLERLLQVQQALADLTDPALLPIEHVGVIAGQLYLVRSHVEGPSLADLLRRSGALDTRQAIEIALGLCDALATVHRSGLIHGGLSPHSVLVKGNGQVIVTDTGLIPALRPVPQPPGPPWGRFPYISPEQAAGENALPASDVYTIGSLMYEMLTGRPPFSASDETTLALQHLRFDPPSLQVLAPNVPSPLAQIVHKALAKEPAVRYRNAGQLAHILRSHFGPQIAARPVEAPLGRQLIVPPPPTPIAVAQVDEEFYGPGPAGSTSTEEFDGVDWLMIGLLVAALLAVLGLIPLWTTVYRRYAVPSSSYTPASYQWTEQGTPLVVHRVDLDPGHSIDVKADRCSKNPFRSASGVIARCTAPRWSPRQSPGPQDMRNWMNPDLFGII